MKPRLGSSPSLNGKLSQVINAPRAPLPSDSQFPWTSVVQRNGVDPSLHEALSSFELHSNIVLERNERVTWEI